jgi:small subunit ribosomal protein S16
MAVKIRLTRLGKKKQPTYRVVVTDSRKARDGAYIEQLGFYDPKPNPSVIDINNERALYWLTTGAQPTERAQKLLEISGAWTQFKIAKGEIHTVGVDDAKPATSKSKAKPKAAEPKVTVSEEADAAVVEETVGADDASVAVEAVEETIEAIDGVEASTDEVVVEETTPEPADESEAAS